MPSTHIRVRAHLYLRHHLIYKNHGSSGRRRNAFVNDQVQLDIHCSCAPMVLILEGNWKISAHVWIDLFKVFVSIESSHKFDFSFRKDLFSFIPTQHVLSYYLFVSTSFAPHQESLPS